MIIENIPNVIIIIFLCILTIKMIYDYFFLFVVLLPVKKEVKYKNNNGKINHFIILIPAHNEREVIEYLLESLSKLNYPKDAYKVFVIADNCQDDTAFIAEMKGATVLQRFNTKEIGKPYAIGWAINQIESLGYEYDAIVIFDADNLVSSDFLMLANRAINGGAEAFQGSVECKNIDDSWVSISDYIAYSTTNRIYQKGRDLIGLGALLCGTGMGFTKSLLQRIPWNVNSLTEDREFTYKLLLNGVKVVWLDDAIVYDEKPVKATQFINQRSRWFSGWILDFKKYFPLFWKTYFKTHEPALLDAMFNLLQPLFFGKKLIIILLPFLILFGNLYLWIWWASLLFTLLIYQGMGLWLNNAKFSYYWWLLVYPFTSILSIGAFIKALARGGKLSWSHTKHNRKVRLEDIEK